jgi:hypothetical protein
LQNRTQRVSLTVQFPDQLIERYTLAHPLTQAVLLKHS